MASSSASQLSAPSSSSSSIQLNSQTNLLKATEFLSLPAQTIFVLSKLRQVSTRYGEKSVAVLDEGLCEIFMPPRFQKDIRDHTLAHKLVFLIRHPQNGSYGGKEYANYGFVVPRRNGCVCGIGAIWDGYPPRGQCCQKVCLDSAGRSKPFCACLDTPDVCAKINNLPY